MKKYAIVLAALTLFLLMTAVFISSLSVPVRAGETGDIPPANAGGDAEGGEGGKNGENIKNGAESAQAAGGAVGAKSEDAGEKSENAGEKSENGGFYRSLGEAIKSASDPENIRGTVTWICSLISMLVITLLRGSLLKLKSKISGTLDSATSKTNELVECYNESNRRISDLEGSLEELRSISRSGADEKTYGAVLSFAEMLFMVYNNSTTIPEGMKDLLREKYAALCKAGGERKESDI